MTASPRLAFAGGGTGGHLYPGLAVAAAVRAASPGVDITFFTTDRPLDRDLLAGKPYVQVPQPVAPFAVNPLRWPRFLLRWRRSLCLATTRLQELRPEAVLGLGGYAAGPVVVAARRLGIRVAILNPDAIPGRANRHLAGRADLVVLQWDVSRRHFADGVKCVTLGCPIRAEFSQQHDPALARRRFQLAPDRPVVVVTGASQGARTVNRAMGRVWPEFHGEHPEWQLLHLSGAADEAEVRRTYAARGAPARVVAFTHEMWDALAVADVVVSRAGGSTLAELTALGKPSILLPYPYHRDQHQMANARVLVDAGAAFVQEDRLEPELNAPALRAALDQLAQADVRMRMGRAAAALGRPGAAEQVAAWLLTGELPGTRVPARDFVSSSAARRMG
ncbi:MAG: UDP-N-acetylglucosamine--N-acetylmuramyl-(pentapeptide) pyrophosphoryl-undecaprenol N-acetylglucosamine transferase [Planctomycetota bacterium]